MARRDEFNPVSNEIPFDNVGTDFESENVRDALIEVGSSASPGFNFGRSGNANANTWLQVIGGVPSNKAGITVALQSARIRQIFVANEDLNTFDIEVYEHAGNSINLTLLGTSSIVSARTATFSVNYSVTTGRQLAVVISSGSAKNVNVGLQLSGSSN